MHIDKLTGCIDDLISRGKPVLIIIDGMAASGKSTLAGRLRKIYECNVIAMDDFFLRTQQQTPERLEQPGGNIDYERFATDVAAPLTLGKPFSYCPYDCSVQTLIEPKYIVPAQLTIVEGVYSMHPEFEIFWNKKSHSCIRVFMRINPGTQLNRLRIRDSDSVKQFISRWLPMENKYFDYFDIPSKCDFIFEE